MRYLHPLKVSSLILLAAVALSAVGVGGETVRYETPKYRVTYDLLSQGGFKK